jgi:hypothetical protein
MASPELNDALTRLYMHYQRGSQTALPREQFITLLTFFPVLLVVAADDHLQDEEQVYVDFIAKAMADTFDGELPDRAAREQLTQHFAADLRYLLGHLREWEVPMMETLRDYLAEMPSLKESVLDVLYLFADAEDDTSGAEAQVIGQVRAELGI